MPLNGEAAYADTVRAFADLPAQQQAELERTMVRRRYVKPMLVVGAIDSVIREQEPSPCTAQFGRREATLRQ